MIKNFLLSTFAIAIVFYILPTHIVGATYTEKGINLLVISVIIAALNILIKPILKIIAFPVNVVTLGLFSLVINAAIIKLADILSPSFEINGFLNYLIFGALLSVVHIVLSIFEDKD